MRINIYLSIYCFVRLFSADFGCKLKHFADLDTDELVTIIIKSRAIMLQPGTTLGDRKERITWLTSWAPVFMLEAEVMDHLHA